ncbi:MAG: response regulator transcription factor [Parasphingorhabdus sp.]|uniref:response regulator transcription factor n=1 Tax=Parasphingorhabdus sp. TaxID=2709688 RepID=UPI00326656BF
MPQSFGPYHAVIADDHAVVRNGLRAVLEKIGDIEVVGEAENGLEAISMTKELRPTLLTLDAAMPLAKGMEVFGEVRRWSPETRVIAVTGFTAKGHLADWIAAEVDGLFLKSCSPDEMKKGFEVVLNGGSYISKQALSILGEHSETSGLTARERQVLHLIAEGFSNAEIASRLSVSAKTVDNHRTRMMAKLDVHSIAQLIAYALKEGLLDQSRQL